MRDKDTLNTHNLIFLMTINKIPVGFLRYDKIQDYFLIDIYIDECFGNRGISSIILKKTMKVVSKKTKIKNFRAYVKKSNIKSKSFFKSSKFISEKEYFSKKINMIWKFFLNL